MVNPAKGRVKSATTRRRRLCSLCRACSISRPHGRQTLLRHAPITRLRPSNAAGRSYLVDYKVGSTLKALADAVPGSTLLVVHHTRKAEAADFVDTVSGTQGIAGSVDFVLVLTRKRHENNAILSVTGRDIIEAEYALHADDGVLWRLDGADLDNARENVQQRRAEASMGDRQMDVYLTVAATDGPVTAIDVAGQLDGMDNEAAGHTYAGCMPAEPFGVSRRHGFSVDRRGGDNGERCRQRKVVIERCDAGCRTIVANASVASSMAK